MAEPEFEMPRNVAAERNLLACLFHDQGAVDVAAQQVRAEDFSIDANRRIWLAALAVKEKGVALTPAALWQEILQRKEADDVKADYIADLYGEWSTGDMTGTFAREVVEASLHRRCLFAGQEIIRAAQRPDLAASEIVALAERELYAIADRKSSDLVMLRDVLPGVVREIQHRCQKLGKMRGVRTGLAEIDDVVCGFAPGALVIIGARTSIGKTAAAVTIALNAARDLVPTAIFSLEQSQAEIGERHLLQETEGDSHHYRQGNLGTPDFEAISDALDRLHNVGVFVDDTCVSMTQIAAACRRGIRRHRLGLVIVDYAQLIQPENLRVNREQQVAAITRQSKLLARELNVPVVLLAQLKRGEDAKGIRKPQLTDLRESGSQEQDADVVLLLWRNESDSELKNAVGKIECHIAKNRNGRTGSVTLAFRRACMKFENLAGEPMGTDGRPK